MLYLSSPKATMRNPLAGSSLESIWHENRSDQAPAVKHQTEPAAHYPDPHCYRRAANLDWLVDVVSIWLLDRHNVPVRQEHRNIHRRQEEAVDSLFSGMISGEVDKLTQCGSTYSCTLSLSARRRGLLRPARLDHCRLPNRSSRRAHQLAGTLHPQPLSGLGT